MDFLELQELFRINTDDRVGDRFDQPTVERLLNAGFRKVWNELLSLEYYYLIAKAEAKFTSSSQLIELVLFNTSLIVRNLQKILRVENSGGKEIPVREEVFSRKGQEESVFMRGSGLLGYHIKPTSSFTLTVDYIPTIFKISADLPGVTNELYIPDSHIDTVVNWATVLALASDEQNVILWRGLYQDSMNLLVDSFQARTSGGDLPMDEYA